MNEGDLHTPDPAQPILASSLLDLEERQRTRFAGSGERISTACGAVDEFVLGGAGLERGVVLGISGEVPEGRLLSLNLIASILVTCGPTIKTTNKPRAAIIDTTGSFPISLLSRVIRSRIIQAKRDTSLTGVKPENSTSAKFVQHDDRDLEREVQRHLEMVTISRVFDVEGLREILSEVSRDSNSQLVHQDRGEGDASTVVKSPNVPFVSAPEGDEQSTIMKEIVDSDDERHTPDEDYQTAAHQLKEQDEGIEMLVVDSMTDIINELFARKEKNEAHNLLGTLATIIHNISSQSNILTILHNSTISSKSSYPIHPDIDPLPRRQSQELSPSLSSVFNSNPLKPALGRIFDQFPSLHLMLSSMPKSRDTAEILFGQNEDALSTSHLQYCTILEVLRDETPNLGNGRSTRRFGEREQRWMALVTSDDGLNLQPAFLEKEKGRW